MRSSCEKCTYGTLRDADCRLCCYQLDRQRGTKVRILVHLIPTTPAPTNTGIFVQYLHLDVPPCSTTNRVNTFMCDLDLQYTDPLPCLHTQQCFRINPVGHPIGYIGDNCILRYLWPGLRFIPVGSPNNAFSPFVLRSVVGR